ncbi:MAG: hypothetical protein HXY34_09930 [Candidatus Thorarchaeota archaeon]|nr:hypothetical protein [Candidatus Thorarchaeota archaeon]
MSKGAVRVFCTRCQKWYPTPVDLSKLKTSRAGLWSLALQHGDHVLTIYIDKELKVRGEAIADSVSTEREDNTSDKAIDFFEKM